MSDTVVFDINGDPKGAEAAFNRVQKELDKTKAKLGELTAEARKSALAGDKVSDAYVKSAKQGEAMAAGMVKSLAASATAAGLLTAALKITKYPHQRATPPGSPRLKCPYREVCRLAQSKDRRRPHCRRSHSAAHGLLTLKILAIVPKNAGGAPRISRAIC